MGVQTSFSYPDFNYFGYNLENSIAGIYDSSIFNVLRNLCPVFHSGCIIFHSCQHCASILIFHILANIFYLLFSDSSHPNRCEVVSHCGFVLHD